MISGETVNKAKVEDSIQELLEYADNLTAKGCNIHPTVSAAIENVKNEIYLDPPPAHAYDPTTVIEMDQEAESGFVFCRKRLSDTPQTLTNVETPIMEEPHTPALTSPILDPGFTSEPDQLSIPLEHLSWHTILRSLDELVSHEVRMPLGFSPNFSCTSKTASNSLRSASPSQHDITLIDRIISRLRQIRVDICGQNISLIAFRE